MLGAGNADRHRRQFDKQGQDNARSEFAMLSVPTLWTVITINFLALALVWVNIMRSYPKFDAARFWTGAAVAAAAGAGLSMMRGVADSQWPQVVGGTLMILACCLAEMGIKRFYDVRVSWPATILIAALSCAGLAYFMVVQDNMPVRILIYSLGQSIPIAMTLKLVLPRRGGRKNPGARLVGITAILILAIHAVRCGCAVLQVGGDVSMVSFDGLQAAMILVLVFLSMEWNFGFLLMAMGRLRSEVADLALLDDLTGVGNRRHLLQRLTEECARSVRSGEPFSLLAIDLDGFKGVNDTHGHAAGDACLQHFALMAQTRLRPGDMLARTGGDEFCIVLPDSTLREGAMIARRVLEVCREDAQACVGEDVPVAVSIGVAQWTRDVGAFPDRLIVAADQALYVAKKDGKNRHAVYEHAPPLAPGHEAVLKQALRKQA
jgi:diguanylate cyclase (GGDEF)-like protein